MNVSQKVETRFSFSKIDSNAKQEMMKQKTAISILSSVLQELDEEYDKASKSEVDELQHLDEFKLLLATDDTLRAHVINSAVLWSATHSFVDEIHLKTSVTEDKTIGNQQKLFQHCPFTLTPITIKINDYLELCEMSAIFHKLFDQMSRDYDFFIPLFSSIAKSDVIINGKIEILKKQQRLNEFNQYTQMYLCRSDYMQDADGKWGQIELNCAGVGGYPFSDIIQNLHNFILNRYSKVKLKYETKQHRNRNSYTHTNLMSPVKYTLESICKTLATAARIIDDDNPLILMIIEKGYNMVTDQLAIESHLFTKYGVRCIRKNLKELHSVLQLDTNTKTLSIEDATIDGRCDITCVYWRGAGSSEKEFSEGYEWELMEMIQFSNAVQEPIGLRLMGTKFMQSVWSSLDVLCRYLTLNEAQKLQKHFFKLHILDTKMNDNFMNIIEDAENNASKYVLKPQRDGGGNNFFDDDIVRIIHEGRKSNDLEERMMKYTLMERVAGKPFSSFFVRERQETFIPECVAEIEVFSCFLSGCEIGEESVIDEVCGIDSKTKMASANEGGICAGYGVRDSVLVIY